MTRYVIQGKWEKKLPTKETLDVMNPSFDNTHVYRSFFINKGKHMPNEYFQDECLNRFDLNQDILDRVVQTHMYSRLWMLDPQFMTLEQAVRIAQLGKGYYLSERYQKMWELAVLRYVSGEKDFQMGNISSKDKKLLIEAEEASLDVESYAFEILNNYDGYVKKDKEHYASEEERALDKELERLSKKEDFCLDLMRDIIVVRDRVLDAKERIKK